MPMIARFVADGSGAAAVKYGLIAICLSLAIATVVQGVGGKVRDAFVAGGEVRAESNPSLR